MLTWPAVSPLSRRSSCTAASSCAERWTRARAVPRAAAGVSAGWLGQRRRRRKLVTWQTTSCLVDPSELTLMTNIYPLERRLHLPPAFFINAFYRGCLRNEAFGQAPLEPQDLPPQLHDGHLWPHKAALPVPPRLQNTLALPTFLPNNPLVEGTLLLCRLETLPSFVFPYICLQAPWDCSSLSKPTLFQSFFHQAAQAAS